ncbi:hypothetical protein C8R47DRAFT_971781, partial [Mycena vitilis]
MAVDATVDPLLCVGSDHLPIHYTLDFEVTRSKSTKFNAEKMDLDIFLGILREKLEHRPAPIINSPEELDEAVDLLNEVLLAAVIGSTPRHRPCSVAKRWWKPLLTSLRKAMRNKRRTYQRVRVPQARTEWLDARRVFYRAISQTKLEVWSTFLKELERVDIYKALN